MTEQNLDDKIQQAGSPVDMLWHSPAGTDSGPITGREVTNWRDEGRSWRETCALFDLSHHMTDVTLGGPDAVRVLSDIGVNSFANFTVGKAKQIVAVNEEGQLIGDAIADYMDTDNIRVAGQPALANWLQYQIETGDYDLTWARDEPTPLNPNHHPEIYRYQVNGPLAMEILEKVNGGPFPEIKFFNAGTLNVGRLRVRGLGHNMSRAKGLELMGPWSDAAEVMDVLLEAGAEFGLARVGSRGPTPATLESGWLPSPLPAVYDGASTKGFRQWLPGNGYEGAGSLGGSLHSRDIADYYLSPQDLGYGRLVKFDHDFIGRDALQNASDRPRRRKVTLAWNTDDVMGVIRTGFEKGTPARQIEWPLATWATWQYDTVLSGDRPVGVSTIAGYTYNERKMLSIAVVDETVAEGEEVLVVWGEDDGGASKPQIEQHVQTKIRAVVSPVPYSDVHNK